MSPFYGWPIWSHVNKQGIAATSVKIVHLDALRNEATHTTAISAQVDEGKGVTHIKASRTQSSLSRNLHSCCTDSSVPRKS